MSYLALYRQFRPTGFDEIIGQDHVVKTLINQINTNRVGHAYLFCGARGTGKTTAAKVFARAINCLSPKNGSPCGECEVCKSLSSTNLDINIELAGLPTTLTAVAGASIIIPIVEIIKNAPAGNEYILTINISPINPPDGIPLITTPLSTAINIAIK